MPNNALLESAVTRQRSNNADNSGSLTITYRAVGDLVPYARNARSHSERNLASIAGSIREFGFTNPVLTDEDGGIIAGHGRVMAARKLGMETVPTIALAGLSKAQKQALVLADNAIALSSGWDNDLLRIELQDLSEQGFDLDLIGFDPAELDTLLAVQTDGLTDPDEVPEAPDEPVSVLGDVWLLGRHRLVCGDCTDPLVVEKALAGVKADMVFTDPPYGVSFQSGMSKGGTATRFDKLANDDTVLDVAPIIEAALREDGAMFVWTAHQVYPAWREQFAARYKQTIIWHKGGGGIGDLKGNYATDYEMCLFGVKGRVRFRGQRGMAVWRLSKDRAVDYRHPTQKPVELAERAIMDFTDSGDTVLDLFGGSGSTLIACERTARRAAMVEIDPKYCDVIVKRWQDHVGGDATLESSGETFNSMVSSRSTNTRMVV